VAATLLIMAMSAFAGVVTFDDISVPTGMPHVSMPAHYGDLHWEDNAWIVETLSDYQNTFGNSYGFPSGTNAAENSGALTVSVTSPVLFNFIGASFAGFAGNDSAQYFTASDLTVTGYRSGVQTGSVSLSLSPSGFQYRSGGLQNIDELRFTATENPGSGGLGAWWLMDDFTYSTPEPSSFVLIGLGLAVVLVARRGTLRLGRR
jgi:hypothetical protein